MSVELNHTIIPTKDKWVSAKFLADILNLEAGPEWGHFVPVKTDNGVTLDFSDSTGFNPRHFAFLVSEAEFDAALARIRAAGVAHYANFRRERPGEINRLYGGRGVYFDDPNGHLMELIKGFRPPSLLPRIAGQSVCRNQDNASASTDVVRLATTRFAGH